MATPTKAEIYKLLKDIKPYEGATQIGVSTKKTDRGPELKFIKALQQYVNEKFFGNTSSALRALGLKRSRIRGIIQRTLGDENRQTGKISQGDVIQTTVPTPKNTIPVTEATTKVKYDKNLFKDKIKNYNKNKFYTPKDIANILGLDVSTKNSLDYLTATFKRFGVKSKDKTGQQKLYQLGDAVNKTTEGFKNKLVKGDRKAQTSRINIISKTDQPLDRFISNIYSRIRSISKDFDIFQPGAVEDVGHPMSVKITDKFPKLFKNSNINKISSLVFQDPQINQKVLEATGYESKHEKLFKELNKFVDKKITPESQSKIINIKKEMNSLYDNLILDINNLSKTNSYFKGQENRIPKIDIKIPKLGETFKSEDLFADMSTVDQSYRVGQVHKINPNAKVLNDLTAVEKDLFEQTLFNQQRNNLEKFYTRAGYSVDEIAELNEAFDIGTDTKKAITNKEVSQNPNLTKFVNNARADAKANGNICKIVSTKLANGGNVSCVNAVEDALQKNPEKLAQDVNRLPYEEGPFNKVKSAATGFLKFAKKGGKFGALAAVGAAGAGAVKTFMNDDPTTYLSNEDQQKNMLIDMVTGQLDDTPVEEAPIGDAQLPVIGAGAVAGTAVTAPSSLKAFRDKALGAKKSGITMSALKGLGRGIATLGTPLGLLATEPLYLAEQAQEGASLGEMATDPFNYLGASFLPYTDKLVSTGLSPKIAKAMRLGISPSVLKTVSRRFGLPGLALSLGISGYETFDDYRNKRGFFSEE